eukprot:CAMPEP_0177656948 /NCGR_PEP_ID=MMETSP0447-20121125/15888_1 /TAXON_ID=0 /ORGANISM="Stygamoeba regulata, Strain BSH-02190019" /LENGTH=413 /DNA_ID=CAMNT_0019161199 /DNA_START=96 /DNA_END=1337 /DNA_ORIENTATION=+
MAFSGEISQTTILDNLRLYEYDTIALWIAAFCTLGACILSFYDIYKHLTNYHVPYLQRYIVRIIWIVPIYAIDSFFSLKFVRYSLYFDTIRDCYEAYVLYSFFSLLVAYLGGNDNLEVIMEGIPPMQHSFPCCMFTFIPGRSFLVQCKRIILQFVYIKPLLAILAVAFNFFGLYGDGEFRWNCAYPYITIVANLSVTLSLYYLVLFYRVTKDYLRPFRPMPKFMCVKAIVFFAWWQGVLINVLTWIGFIHQIGNWSTDTIALSVQDFLICVEMLIIAILHRQVFGYEEYSRDPQVRAKMLSLATPHDSTVAFAMRSLSRTGDNVLVDDYHGGDLSSDSDSEDSPKPRPSRSGGKQFRSPSSRTPTPTRSNPFGSSSVVRSTLAPLLDVVSQRDVLNDTIEVLSVVEDKHSKET